MEFNESNQNIVIINNNTMDNVDFLTKKIRAFNKPNNREIIIRNRIKKYNDEIISQLRPEGAYIRPTKSNINSFLKKYRDNLKKTQRQISKSYTREFTNIMRRKDRDKSYNLIFTKLINNELKLKDKQINKLINRIRDDNKFIEFVNNEGQILQLPASGKTIDFLQDLIKNNFKRVITDNNAEQYGSDRIDNFIFDEMTEIKIANIGEPDRNLNRDVAFFKYINISGLDLSNLQIYDKEYCNNADIYERENCFIHTLSEQGIPNEKLNIIKSSSNMDNYVKAGHSFKKKDIKHTPDIIERNIRIYEFKKSNNDMYKTDYFQSHIPPEERRILSKDDSNFVLGAVHENHYFVYEKNTIYSKFYIDNIEKIENALEEGIFSIKDFHSKYDIVKLDKGKYPVYDSTKGKINTLLLVKKLLDKELFVKGDLSKFYEYNKAMDIKYGGFNYCLDNLQKVSLNDSEQEIDYNTHEIPKIKKCDEIFYADIESYVNASTTGKHELALLGFTSSNTDVRILNEKDFNDIPHLLNTFFRIITQGRGKKDVVKVYFHNLKYDYNIIEKHLKNINSVCKKDGQLYQVKIFGKCDIQLIDSYKLLPFKLSEFNKNLGLDKSLNKKDAINYDLFTKENNGKLIDPLIYRKGLSKDDKNIFDIESKSFINQEGLFDITGYYSNYLRYDCLTLKAGMEKMDKILLDITRGEISVYDKLTISSLTNHYMLINGAYDGVYETTGNIRDYIAHAVYGGRVHVNQKFEKKVIDKKLADYDGVSLYPSAIKRLCSEFGLPLGNPMRFEDNEYNRWSETDYCVMTVRINKINKFQQMPIIAVKSQNSIDYVNHIKEPITVIIDKYTLEDYIKLHEIDYEIIDGLYYNNGFNKKMGDLINELFNKRIVYKSQGNKGMSNVLKLMMNSSYGKTIMKKSYDKINIVKGKYEDVLNEDTGEYSKSINQKYINYLYNNYNTIEEVRPINDYISEVKQSKFDNSGNLSHVGCAILSMSKRIMNEVFDVCNTNAYPIYYTDTDSLHMDYDDVSKFENKFQEEYNRNITGKDLGQFHIDFDMDGAESEIYSTKAIFLGKKSYIDVLESKDKYGNLISGIHSRMKGATEEGMEELRKSKGGDMFQVYKELSEGKELPCVLNPFNYEENSQKAMFDFSKEGVITRKCGEFVRKLKF